MERYRINHTQIQPDFSEWNASSWKNAEKLRLNFYYPQSKGKSPQVTLQFLYDEKGIYSFYQVFDQCIRATFTEDQSSVCLDSCVEFFVQPENADGYFNFEFNCIGTLLSYYIRNPKLTPGKDYDPMPESAMNSVKRYPTCSGIQESDGPVSWTLGFFIPWDFFRLKCAIPNSLNGTVWRCNFFKCGNKAKYPHWLAWRGNDILNFHQPQCFGELEFR